MIFRKIALATAALGLAAAPVAAESLRDAAPVTGESKLEGQSDIFLILGAAAIIAGIIIIASDDNDPVSG
ncbi:hypothetical protein [Parerythrobacter aestuarii]|uniref:hypothetical protein n=1 Tax=Parerythrobacter aestuarii TaxID=3020909 RepID=UPI0024DE2421|nr:hypothetical protein [Parerythrobacter aestuarii]